MSGTEQGAGGVGGLLWLTDGVGTAQERTAFCGYDASGNVIALVQATDPLLGARYEYGPFGEVIRMTGPLAAANPFPFLDQVHRRLIGPALLRLPLLQPLPRPLATPKTPSAKPAGLTCMRSAGNDPSHSGLTLMDVKSTGLKTLMAVSAIASSQIIGRMILRLRFLGFQVVNIMI